MKIWQVKKCRSPSLGGNVTAKIIISNLVTPGACTSTPTVVITSSMVTVAPSSVPDDCPTSKHIYLMYTV